MAQERGEESEGRVERRGREREGKGSEGEDGRARAGWRRLPRCSACEPGGSAIRRNSGVRAAALPECL